MSKTPKPEWKATPLDFQRAFAAVGQFLFNWGHLESSLNDLIAKGLKIDDFTSIIITSNVQFRDKLHIAGTIVDLQGRPAEWKAHAQAVLEKARKASLDRNLLAHNSYGPREKGVKFYVFRAKGKIEIPDTIWKYTDFDAKYAKLHSIDAAIMALIEDIKAPDVRRFGALGGLYALGSYASSTPILGIGALGDVLQAAPLAPEDQGSGEPTPSSGPRRIGALRGIDPIAPIPEIPPLSPPPPKGKRAKKSS